MSLLNRVSRPIKRNDSTYRDDRLSIVACDDTFAPKQYFNFFKLPRVRIHVVHTEDGSSAARHVLNRLLQVEHFDDDERWLVLDVDHYTQGTHLASFTATLADARKQGVRVALSKPCFELWLFLHHVEETEVADLATADDVTMLLRREVGEYNKTNLKSQHDPLSAVHDACMRAERLDLSIPGGELPAGNTTRIYLLCKAIVSKALPSQLPAELRMLLRL